MNELMDSIENNLKSKNLFGALFLSMMVPSICGALNSSDNKDTKRGYILWYKKYVEENLVLTGEHCYWLRCKLLHQGITSSEGSKFPSIYFSFPSNYRAQNVTHTMTSTGTKVLGLDIEKFCEAMLDGIRSWHLEIKGNRNFERNLKKSISIHPEGFAPYLTNFPVIY